LPTTAYLHWSQSPERRVYLAAAVRTTPGSQ